MCEEPTKTNDNLDNLDNLDNSSNNSDYITDTESEDNSSNYESDDESCEIMDEELNNLHLNKLIQSLGNILQNNIQSLPELNNKQSNVNNNPEINLQNKVDFNDVINKMMTSLPMLMKSINNKTDNDNKKDESDKKLN